MVSNKLRKIQCEIDFDKKNHCKIDFDEKHFIVNFILVITMYLNVKSVSDQQ